MCVEILKKRNRKKEAKMAKKPWTCSCSQILCYDLILLLFCTKYNFGFCWKSLNTLCIQTLSSFPWAQNSSLIRMIVKSQFHISYQPSALRMENKNTMLFGRLRASAKQQQQKTISYHNHQRTAFHFELRSLSLPHSIHSIESKFTAF